MLLKKNKEENYTDSKYENNKNTDNEFKYKEFDDIPVSTKTFIVTTNLLLNINELFNNLPVSDFTLIPKKRGRKKKNDPGDPNKDIKDGSIIMLEHQNNIRGVDLKKKKNKKNKERGNYFRNSVTIVMIINNKKINFKVSRNGKFQMTGCKYNKHAEDCVKWIWYYIKDKDNIYSFCENIDNLESNYRDITNDIDTSNYNNLKAIFIPAMRNIDFSLNFCVDREKLDEYFNKNTKYHSLLETSFGYTGVNIKIPITKNIETLKLKQLEYIDDEWVDPVYISYGDYLSNLPEKEKNKKIKKQRFNTFLVFHSGKTIMSGIDSVFMKDVYYDFLNIIKDCSNIIKEKLVEL